MGRRTYTDEALREAVATARSWRGVLRSLGLHATSSAAQRSVRAAAESLGLDTAHIRGGRRWTEAELADAVRCSTSWPEVAAALGLAPGSSTTVLKGHAARLGIDTSHLSVRSDPVADLPAMQFDPEHLPRSGAIMAAAWFSLCGYEVSWPLEPCPYDLVAARHGRPLRVQVKTTRCFVDGTWRVGLSSASRQAHTYDPDDVDYFFVIDADFDYYLIPATVVGGRTAIFLSAYERFKLPQPLLQPT